MRLILILILAFIVSACDNDGSVSDQSKDTVNHQNSKQTEIVGNQSMLTKLYRQSAQNLLEARPTYATVLGVGEDLAGDEFQSKLGDYSPAAEQQLRQRFLALNKDIEGQKADAGHAAENKAVMMHLNHYYAGADDFSIGYIDPWMGLSPFIVNQINGPLIDVPNRIVTNQPLNSEADVLAYIARLQAFDGMVQSVVAKLDADVSQDWIPPKVIVEQTIKGLESFVAPAVKEHPLYQRLSKELPQISELSAERRDDLLVQAEQAIEQNVYGSYGLMIHLQQQLVMKARAEAGIWAQPNGAAYYRQAVKTLGDTDLTPDAIHQLGLDEVDRINTELDALLKSQGYQDGTVAERLMVVNQDPAYLYEDSDAGRLNVIADLNRYIDEFTPKLAQVFNSTPPYGIEVRPFPKAREASAPGGMYSSPSIDGSQPGIYWINLRDIKAVPTFEMKTLTYHEANPGHHWQIAGNLAQVDLPLLRRIASFNAFSEGWALYAELLAKEMGQYEDDPMSDVGRLKAELFRAVRLVVDTGLHHKKWTRQEAIDYMKNVGAVVESDAVAEVERYMVWPGQALGYKLGMIEILQLRAKAQKQLGEQFSIKDFHDWVLMGGAVPMSILAQRVNQAINK
ncbi:Tat pathway signal protein [Marinicella pacifica]|uniref:Tat pathway signal protein n=1 Tax=Marinicella pacifica TaxID=1171543 RepID=A0A917CJ65_9GAMM|nr:DUF885 domain-containing protein [Marinicella pacifica]GGF89345.1 Tat pathway signal protein [Marinicella pacifica]